MKMELSHESQQILEELVASGKYESPTDVLDRALQLLKRTAAIRRERPSQRLSKEEWIRRFREWAESHPPVGHDVDDSRDSIYSGTIDDPR